MTAAFPYPTRANMDIDWLDEVNRLPPCATDYGMDYPDYSLTWYVLKEAAMRTEEEMDEEESK